MDMDMKLDYDILLMVLATVKHKATLISLMKTCHALYTNGIPALLCLPNLCEFSYHFDGARLAGFCEFMLVDNRCRYLTYLGIGSRFESHPPPFNFAKNTVKRLVGVLKRAVNLKDLTIFYNEWLFEAHPILATTISSLTSLQRLSLRGEKGGPRTAEMMKQTRSPIKVMDMARGFLPPSEWSNDPIPILSGFCSTLEKLETSMYELTDTSTVFPHLHTLSVTMGTFDDIWPLITCFPNLHSLTFQLHVHESRHPRKSELERTRQSNQDRQRAASWPWLRSLSGTPLSLYLLAVCSPVDHLHITDAKGTMDLLLYVLTETLFTRLTITLLTEWELWENLPCLLSSSTKLTHTSVLLEISWASPPILDVLNELSGFIQCPSVTFLQIRLQPYSGMDMYCFNKLVGIDHIQAYAPQVFGIIPTLRYACFALGVDFRSSWEVYRRNDESPVPELLSKKDGELVIEAEWDMYE